MSLKEVQPHRVPSFENDAMADMSPLKLYLREVGKTPLLTDEEERWIGQKLDAGKYAKQQLATADESLTDEERHQYETMIIERDDAADWLTRANQRFVMSIAKKYQYRGVPFLDLVQEGNIGLATAIDKMDWKRGTKFVTYAGWWVRQAIGRAVHNSGGTIRIPVHTLERIYQYRQCCDSFMKTRGREPTIQEAADLLGKTEKQVKWYQYVSHIQPRSLDEPILDEDDDTSADFGEMRETNGPTVVEQVEAKDSILNILNIIDVLPQQESRVLKLRLGLVEGGPKKQKEVGTTMGITTQRVQQIETRARRKLKLYEQYVRHGGEFPVQAPQEEQPSQLPHMPRSRKEAMSLRRHQHISQSLLNPIIIDAQTYLSPRQAEMVTLRLGTTNRPAMTYREIGDIFGVSKEYVYATLVASIRKMYGISSFPALYEYIAQQKTPPPLLLEPVDAQSLPSHP